MRGSRKPEKIQGLIHYTCLNYDTQPRHIKDKIDRLCRIAGGAYSDALKDLLLHGHRYTCERIAMDHYCSANTLWAARRRFYDLW